MVICGFVLVCRKKRYIYEIGIYSGYNSMLMDRIKRNIYEICVEILLIIFWYNFNFFNVDMFYFFESL